MERRITIRDIAEVAQVHFTTVSMALRGNPRIPEKTRLRIRKIADEMGYRPDAMLSALSNYRINNSKRQHQATVAWINNYPERSDLMKIGLYCQYLEGAQTRAEELGFRVEEFWLHQPDLTRERVTTILRTRNIRGVLVAPIVAVDTDFDLLPWDELAAVTFGHSLKSPMINRVIAHQYHSMSMILREVRALGYRRLGLAIDSEFDQRCDQNWQAAYWVDYHAQPLENRVEPFWYFSKKFDTSDFSTWLKTQNPEVILPMGRQLLPHLRKLGYRVPEDIGVVHHDTTPDDFISGVDQNGLHTGKVALETLVAMLGRQEFGVPEIPQEIAIEGNWVPGSTLRKQP
ncbi:MAG: LacI family DNA-binding transcriptional regulator [Puniceicoccales bacterium]